jgi:nucleoside-diphosphate-sugar epimerase
MSGCTAFDPVLVTGGSGFVGACVVHELLARGHRVHVLLREHSRLWRLDGALGRLTVHRADLLDANEIRSVIGGVRPGAVLHLAAYGAYESQSDARRILETNILGSYNLLEASAAADVKVFISTGSSSEYGFKPEPMREGDRLEPNSFYAVAKAAQTHLCSLAARRGPMGVAVFRIFSAYGPWEESTRLVPTVLHRARAGLPLQMTSPETAREFVYVAEVVVALLDLPAAARLKGDVINLGTGVETTLREVVETVLVLTGSRSAVRWGAMKARSWDTNRWSADPSLAGRLLGWAPRHNLREGLAKTLAWLEAKGANDAMPSARDAA